MIRLLFILFLLAMPGFLSAQQATATPWRGEGISTFLERNGRPGRAYYNEFLKLNKKRLKGKKELMYGVRYVLPPRRDKDEASAKERRGKGGTPFRHKGSPPFPHFPPCAFPKRVSREPPPFRRGLYASGTAQRRASLIYTQRPVMHQAWHPHGHDAAKRA